MVHALPATLPLAFVHFSCVSAVAVSAEIQDALRVSPHPSQSDVGNVSIPLFIIFHSDPKILAGVQSL